MPISMGASTQPAQLRHDTRWNEHHMSPLRDLPTPCLVLRRDVMERNCARMLARSRALGVSLRPHLKTAKSIEVARRTGASGITVSTLREAAYFLAHGIRDLTYAVGLEPSKLGACAALAARGAVLTLITDDLEVARTLAREQAQLLCPLRVLIEVDVGQHRGGVLPESDELLAIGDALGRRLVGVIAHAGHAYEAPDVSTIGQIAEEERAGAVRAAARLRSAGHEIGVVSVGSTPTAVHAAHLEGVTELRAGVYVFFDRFQHAIGSCDEDDLALTVLTSVVGVRREAGLVVVDAGSLALSADSSMVRFGGGFGEVRDLGDRALAGSPIVRSIHQEHGTIELGARAGSVQVGERFRIRPGHACITAAMHTGYAVVESDERVIAYWDRIHGWAAD